MTLFKNVNGVNVQLTPSEEAAQLADWAANATPPPPTQISAMQAKVALSRAGLLTSVQNWVNTQSAEVQLIWNTAPHFSRNSALIAAGAVALNLSSAQLDSLFRTAIAISP